MFHVKNHKQACIFDPWGPFRAQKMKTLNITNPEDTASYVSHKSLWTMRDILAIKEIYNEIFTTTLRLLAELFKADLKKQRMDSVHIQYSMRHG